MSDPRPLLSWLNTAAEAILLWRLMAIRLAPIYRWFALFLGVDVARAVYMWATSRGPHSNSYAWTWVSTEPLLLLLQLAFAIELYRLISSHYRNFDRYRLRLFSVCFGAASAATALTLAVDLKHIVWKSPLLQSVFLADRVVTFTLAAFVTVTAAFVRIFPIPIRPNVVRHGWLSTIFFLSNAANYFAIGMGWLSTFAAGVVLMCITGACYVAWAVLMTRAGEHVDTPPGPTDDDVSRHLQRGDDLVRSVRSIKP